MYQRTSAGSDVHARSEVAAAIEGVTGEVFRRTMTPEFGEIPTWVSALPGPVQVTYEAAPICLFGLARFLIAFRRAASTATALDAASLR